MINLKDRLLDNNKIRYFAFITAFISTIIFAVFQMDHLLHSSSPIGVIYYLITTILMGIFSVFYIRNKNDHAATVLIPFNIISIAFIIDSSPVLHFLIEGRNNLFSSPLVLDIFSIMFIVVTICLMISFSVFFTKGIYKNSVLYLSIINTSLLIIQQVYNYIIYEVYYFPWSYFYKAFFFSSVFLLTYAIDKGN